MSVTEIKQAIGQWSLRLRPETPSEILDALTYFGHIAIVPGRVNPAEAGDNILAAARYVGVYRGRSAADDFELRGGGMALWLGDEDDKGDVFETAITFNAATFATVIAGLLPPGGAVTSGVIGSVPGTYTGSHQWQTPRQALTYVTDTYSTPSAPVEWRVTNDGKLDAGLVSGMYVTDPKALLVRKDSGRDLSTVVFPGTMSLSKDAEDLTTRVVLLAEGEGASIATGSANAPATPYKDIHGNPIKMTRLSSESETSAGNANTRASLLLNRFTNPTSAVELSASAYDIKADFVVGDYIDVYDPVNGFVDAARERYWKGERINPVAIRCVEMTWPIVSGWTVAFRDSNGLWIDLSPWYVAESGDTTIVVGDLPSALTGTGGSVDFRPNIGGADTTVPAAPTFNTPFASVAYQSGKINDARSAVYITWNEPLNTDASTITDGSHYEIRYRSNQTYNYPVTWAQESSFQWNQLQTWGRPLSNPADAADQWNYINVGWDQNSVTIHELMVAAQYEFQIRAVDSANPPNSGAWSASVLYTTTADVIAPSVPAAPSVASSLIAVQVTHNLGLATGGTFNLENDLDHLEVHVGAQFFAPDNTTLVGKLQANAGNLIGKIPVVGTFQIPNTSDVWVKVVAVDTWGNKSGPSAAVQSTASLIDDAHISDLTASKITAGTVSANLLLSASIRTAETGQRVELNSTGFQAYDSDGELATNLSADPDSSGQFIGFRLGGETLAQIDDTGRGLFQSVNVAETLEVAGFDVINDLYIPRPRGIIAWGTNTSLIAGSGSGGANERGAFEISFVAEADRLYTITFACQMTDTLNSDRVLVWFRDGGENTPTITSPTVYGHWAQQSPTAGKQTSQTIAFSRGFTAGTHRILVSFYGESGTASIRGDNGQSVIYVEDVGVLPDNTLVLNDGGTGGVSSSPLTTYTKTYSATWSRSYSGGGDWESWRGTECHQGQYGSSSGNRRSLIGFNDDAIRADLNGATILSCHVRLSYFHWYWNAGGTAIVGTHNYDGAPGSWSGTRVTENRLQFPNWPKPGTKTVSLGTTIGNEFKSGVSKGIAIGPGPSTNLDYYGQAYGQGTGSTREPRLVIKYQK